MNRDQALTATLDETRDALAEMDGAYFAMDREIGPIGWCDKNGTLIGDHPHPPTLDGADAAVPEGWTWERHYCQTMHRWEWAAWKPNPDPTGRTWARAGVNAVPDTGNKTADLYRLAVLCWLAEREASK